MGEVTLIPKFKPLYENNTRYFVLTGGRGSSKSFHVNDFLLKLSYEQGHTILFTRWTMISAHLSVIPEFTDKIDRYNVAESFNINTTEITNNHTGSKILFKGIKTSAGNQTASLKSLQGITTLCIDEAEELVDENTFDKIDLSVRQIGVQNRIILILNPATKEHWIYKRFFEDAGVQPGFNGVKNDTTYIHTTYLDNIENLPEDYIKRFEQMRITKPDRYAHQVLGGWLDKAEGVIFTDWEIGEFNNDIPSVFGQDFGYSTDPTTLVQVAIDEKRKQIYLKELLYKPNLVTDVIAEINLTHAKDRLIVADSAEPRLIAELKSKGCNIVGVKKGSGSITEGITLIKGYKLIIDPDSTNLIKELNNYSWVDKNNKPIDAFNHAIDALRYAITHSLADVNKGKYFVY